MAKERTVVKKKNSMSWAESKEAGTEAGQGRGKLLSGDWLTKSSPGFRSPRIKGKPPSLYNRCLPIYVYGFSKGAGPLLKTKEKN